MTMATIIDYSEHLSNLTVLADDSLIIEKDAGTPLHETHVHVAAQSVVLDADSTITIKHDATLNVGGLTNVGALGTFDIGNLGTLNLSSALGLQVAANIKFIGHTESTRLILGNADFNVLGSISGFGAHDSISTPHSAATTGTWNQGLGNTGVLTLFNAAHHQVGAITLQGTYTTANFAVNATAKGGAVIRYVASQDAAITAPTGIHAAGFALPQPAHQAAFGVAGASLHGGTAIDHAADAMMGMGQLHHALQHS
jgi:hypothetical protein